MSDLKEKRVVIIDDNVMNLAVFATTLRKRGATVIQDAWNTGTAEFLLRNLPVDLILLDLMLRKGKSGYDAFDEWQQHPELKDIPVIAVSSLDGETEIPKAQAKGFAGFISKPINAIKFPDQIATCMNGGKVWITSR